MSRKGKAIQLSQADSIFNLSLISMPARVLNNAKYNRDFARLTPETINPYGLQVSGSGSYARKDSLL